MFFLINIHDQTDSLKRKKGNANGQRDIDQKIAERTFWIEECMGE